MANELTSREPKELSADINVITAEINAYQQVAGEAIFEIGRRLHHVRYNPKEYGLPEGNDKHGNTIVARGAWGEWLTEIQMSARVSQQFIKIFEELGESKTRTSSLNVGMQAFYEIATLPPEERDIPHELPTGETKKPDEMTVRELRELKRQLKQAEKQTEAERKERERLEQENEELRNKEPEDVNAEPYDRTMDFPYDVQQGNDFYAMLNDVDDLYKRYAHLKDGIEELRNIAKYDEDMQVKYRKASEFWQMLEGIFSSDDRVEVVDASYVEIN